MTTRLIRSDEYGVYGEIITDKVRAQVLFSFGTEGDIDHGIHVEKGGISRFDFYITVPIDTYKAIVELDNDELFITALKNMIELLEPRSNGSMND